MRKRFKKLAFTFVAASAALAVSLGAIWLYKSSKSDEDDSTMQTKASKPRVSVHDPSIVKDGNNYYVFGSHIEAAKSTDLKGWTTFTNGYNTPGNKIFGDLSENLKGSFAWAGEDDGDNLNGYAVWAPFVFFNADYVNIDGSKGAYMNYYCTSSTYKRSAIGYAVAKNIDGPYTYVDTIVYSGFTEKDSYDTKSGIDNYSKINTKYSNTNIQKLIEDGILSGVNPNWFTAAGEYNTSYAPNAIDPALFYDKGGKLWMTYGSWSGGIYMLEIDKGTGKAIYPGKDETTAGSNPVDRYFGIKLAGGYGKSGEGPFIVYDMEEGYYYLYVTYGGLAADGGYNMRLFRSKNPEGPYVDAKGNNAILPDNNTQNVTIGIKLMGNYKFSSFALGYKSPGHNSAFIDSDGQRYIVYHTRFNQGSEYHEVRVHQMFINEDGWPVVVPYENNGDKISKEGYSPKEIVGSYELINHGINYSNSMQKTLKVNLNKDNTITGDITGTWSMTKGTYYMNMIIGEITYKGVFFKQNDESKYDSKVMTFTAVGSNNQCIWGSKIKIEK